MSDQARQQLQQANALIQSGQRDQARALLESLVKTEPNNAEAWWLLAMVASTPTQMRDALQNVLRIQPDNLGAKQQLHMLDAQAGATSPADRFITPQPTKAVVPPSGSQIGESLDDFFEPLTTPPTASAQPGPVPGYIPPAYVPPATKKQRSPVLYVLLGLAIALVCICGACGLLAGPSFATIFGTAMSMIQAPSTLPGDATQMGTLRPNQTQSGSAGLLEQQVWKYNGRQGEQITVTASGPNLEIFLGVYDPKGQLVSRTRFGNTGRAQSLTATLPEDGTYSILVGSLAGASGSYTISVQSPGSSQ
jgi:Tetratricopeptide repeat